MRSTADQKRIYLDNNSTTQIDDRVLQVMMDVMRQGPANASSLHQLGRTAAARIDDAVQLMGRCLGVRLDAPGGPRMVLTSGGTESNNLAIHGIADEGPLAVSRVEHPSVLMVAAAAEALGRTVHWIEVDHNGIVCLDSLESCLQLGDKRPSMVAIMSANNETGVCQPIEDIAQLCQRYDTVFHIDATQSVGKLPLDLMSFGRISLTLTAHKFHGPQGIGGLFLGTGVKLNPLLHGGEQQLQSRPGTEPVALIVGMASALKIAIDELDQNIQHTRKLRDHLESELVRRFPSWIVHGQNVTRLPHTSCISMLGADRQKMLMALDLAGISCSSGSACSSGSSPPSHVLQAMRCHESQLESAIRFGVSKFSTSEEINAAIERISLCYNRLA